MENKTNKKQPRLSLEDFKLKKIDGKNEIENLLGGSAEVAASCHQITILRVEGIISKAQFD